MKKSLHEVLSFFTTSVLFLLWFCLLNKHETNVQMIVYCYTLQWIVLCHKNQREHTLRMIYLEFMQKSKNTKKVVTWGQRHSETQPATQPENSQAAGHSADHLLTSPAAYNQPCCTLWE